MKKTIAFILAAALTLGGCSAEKSKNNSKDISENTSVGGAYPEGYKRLIFGAEISEETLEEIVGEAVDSVIEDTEGEAQQGADTPALTTAKAENESGNTVTTTKKGAESTMSSSNVVYRGDSELQRAIEQGFAVPSVTDSAYTIDRIVSYGGSKKNYGIFPKNEAGEDFGSILASYITEPKTLAETISKASVGGERELEETEIEIGGKTVEALFVTSKIDVGDKVNTTKSLHFMTDEHTKFIVNLSAYSDDTSDEVYFEYMKHFDFSNAVLDSAHIDEKAQ